MEARLQKIISQAGLASRRAAEAMILETILFKRLLENFIDAPCVGGLGLHLLQPYMGTVRRKLGTRQDRVSGHHASWLWMLELCAISNAVFKS